MTNHFLVIILSKNILVGDDTMQSKYHEVTNKFIEKWDGAFLLGILDNISDIVVINDVDTTIVYVNKAYESILGFSDEKSIGRKLTEIQPEAIAIEATKFGKAYHNVVEKLNRRNKDDFYAVGISFPIYKDDEIMGAVSIFNDVTEISKLTEELHREREIVRYYKKQLDKKHLSQSFDEYVCKNSKTKDVLFLASKVAKTDSTVLIRGESGVGKEVLARAICNESTRSGKPFIKVNCASIPENLLESELMGYEEGAFTGAKKGGKMGKFELAQGGTIFLDEIGDMNMSMQAKILRVLQEKELERVGGNKTIKLDVRIIAATHRNLEDMIEEGTFRSDLYYRLNVVPLFLPPLRERKDDIILLSRAILKRLNNKSGDDVYLATDTVMMLQNHEWLGNIRELQNVLEHANIIRTGNLIRAADLPRNLVPEYKGRNRDFEKYNLKRNIEVLEKELISESLLRNKNNKSKVIEELGISRRAFYSKMEKYGLLKDKDKEKKE